MPTEPAGRRCRCRPSPSSQKLARSPECSLKVEKRKKRRSLSHPDTSSSYPGQQEAVSCLKISEMGTFPLPQPASSSLFTFLFPGPSRLFAPSSSFSPGGPILCWGLAPSPGLKDSFHLPSGLSFPSFRGRADKIQLPKVRSGEND